MKIPFIPSFRHSDKGKQLFNPILKKRYENRPEERVRLGVLEEVLASKKWSANRIGFELRAKHEVSDLLRTDLIGFTQSMQAELLIECKAEDIALNKQTVSQAFRYNQKTQAKWVILTNGRQEICFEQKSDDSQEYKQIKEPPYRSRSESILPISNSAAFWINKGFLDESTSPIGLKILNAQFGHGVAVQWLDLPPLDGFPVFSHFYKSLGFTSTHWITVVAPNPFNCWLVEVFKEKGQPVIQAFDLKTPNFHTKPINMLRFENGNWTQKIAHLSLIASKQTLEELKDFLL